MLISCKECGLQVSDKALTCPHCGYPQNNAANRSKYQQRGTHKRLKLPNGFGQITEIKNPALRNRFRVMVTVGHDENGRPISKTIKPVAYFKTYNEAYQALVEFNKKKVTLNGYGMTMDEVYKEWYEYCEENTSQSYIKGIKIAWKYCEPIKNLPIADVKAKTIKNCIIEADTSANFKTCIKGTLSTLFNYAIEMEYTDKNPVRSIRLPKAISEEREEAYKPHSAFSDEEIQKLWDYSKDDQYAKMILIQCYSGWRPGELVDLKTLNVDLEKWTFRGGLKTKAGKDRIVPIHSKIRDFVKYFYNIAVEYNSEYLFTTHDIHARLLYRQYHRMFDRVKNAIGLDEQHRPHDSRKHFVTEAKKHNVDEYAVKRIVGHAIADLTENVYTDRDVEWLRTEIEKI